MKEPTAPIFPLLDKSYLFVHLPTDPQNQSTRYLQCPATGHLYCMSTGSLYQKIPIVPPLSTDILSLPQRNKYCLPSVPPPCTMKMFSVYSENTDQQDIVPSTILSTESNMSPKAKVVDAAIQGNSAPATQNNKAPNADLHTQDNDVSTILNIHSNIISEVKNRDLIVQCNNAVEPVQGNSALFISKTTSKVKHVSQPIQGKSSSIISYAQDKKNPNVMKVDQPIQGISAAITPNTRRKKASKSKANTTTQVNSPVPSANSSAFTQSNSDPNTHKKIKKRSRKTKDKSVPLVENSCINPKNKSASSKQKKSTVPPQPKPNISFIYKSSTLKNTASITQTTKKSESNIHPDNTLSSENKRKSYTYYQFYLHHMIHSIHPMQINFQDILFPKNVSPIPDQLKVSAKYAKRKTARIPVCSLPSSNAKRAPKYRKKRKPLLYFSRSDCVMMYLEYNIDFDFIRKTVKKKKIMCQYLMVSKTFEDELTLQLM